MVTGAQATMVGKRILVVEDDYFIAKSLVRDLRALGAEVVGPVASVADALALVAAGPLDGAALDVNLCGEAGYPVADALAGRGVPFVLTTGYSADALPPRYTTVPRCNKPVSMTALAAALFQTDGSIRA